MIVIRNPADLRKNLGLQRLKKEKAHTVFFLRIGGLLGLSVLVLLSLSLHVRINPLLALPAMLLDWLAALLLHLLTCLRGLSVHNKVLIIICNLIGEALLCLYSQTLSFVSKHTLSAPSRTLDQRLDIVKIPSICKLWPLLQENLTPTQSKLHKSISYPLA